MIHSFGRYPHAEQVRDFLDAQRAKRRRIATWLTWSALALYAVSIQTFVIRDPLGADVGFQGTFQLACVGAGFLLACIAAVTAQVSVRLPASIAPFGVYGLAALFSSLNSFYPMLSVAKAGMFFMLICTTLLAVSVLEPRGALRAFYWSMVAVVIAGLIVGAALPTTYPLLWNTQDGTRLRFTIFNTHPGQLADFLVLTLLIGRLMRPAAPRLVQMLLLLPLALTAARTSIAGLVVVALLAALGGATHNVGRKLLLTLPVVGVIGYLALAPPTIDPGQINLPIPAELQNIVLQTIGLTQRDLGSLDGRLPLWSSVLDLVGNVTVGGYGFDGARSLLLDFKQWAGTAHNGFLDLVLSSGWLGTIAFAVGWGAILRRAWWLPGRQDRANFYALNLYIVLSALVGGVLSGANAPAIVLFVAMACLAQAEARAPARAVPPLRSLRPALQPREI